jgi:RNase adapter protein RapZ
MPFLFGISFRKEIKTASLPGHMNHLHLLIVSGLSGSGKSSALNALEDSGYFCVDNFPVLLLPDFLKLRSGSGSEVQKLALGMDLREKEFAERHQEVFGILRKEGYFIEILFLEASEEVLLKRFSQTRRQHPVARGLGLVESIRLEKDRLMGLKEIADKVIDTSHYTVHQLKDLVIQYANRMAKAERMRVGITSFGYKYGIPAEADLLIDVRFVPNPYFIPELKGLDGRDDRVRRFVMKWPETQDFLEKYLTLLDLLVPLYEKEGRSYLTIAVGCTGGRHRSVAIAAEIYEHVRGLNRVTALTHRDLELD